MINIHFNDYDHVAFDLDGVLVDSTAVIESALRQWAHEKRLNPDDVMPMSAGRRDIELVAAIAPSLSPERESARIADYEIQAMRLLQSIQGAAEFYSSVPARKRSIVTSSTRASALARLRASSISWPQVMIAAEDVNHGKPHPEPYQTLLRMLHITPSRCLVFEDSQIGIEAATAAGCHCIGVGLQAIGHPGIKGWIANFCGVSLLTDRPKPAFRDKRSAAT